MVPVNKVNLDRVYSFTATNGKTCCVYLVADAFFYKHKNRKYYWINIMVFTEILTFAGKGRKNKLSRVKNFIAWELLTFKWILLI